MLILRDLHAGPARFVELQKGLTGIATNLLSGRLEDLIERREAAHGVTLYQLTELGWKSGDLLFELGRFGGHFAPDEEHQAPGNLRTVAVTLTFACRRVLKPGTELRARLMIDGEAFHLEAAAGDLRVLAGSGPEPDVTLATSYEPSFVRDHCDLAVGTAGKEILLFGLLGDAIALLRDC